MKYDVDLQEIDAIRRARNVYEEESASGGRRREKECSRSRERSKEKRRKREGEAEIYANDYYATDATSEGCLSWALRRKVNPFSNITSRGSRREARCSPRTARAIIISYVPEELLSFSLSLFLFWEALMFCWSPSEFTKKSNISPQCPCILHAWPFKDFHTSPSRDTEAKYHWRRAGHRWLSIYNYVYAKLVKVKSYTERIFF